MQKSWLILGGFRGVIVTRRTATTIIKTTIGSKISKGSQAVRASQPASWLNWVLGCCFSLLLRVPFSFIPFGSKPPPRTPLPPPLLFFFVRKCSGRDATGRWLACHIPIFPAALGSGLRKLTHLHRGECVWRLKTKRTLSLPDAKTQLKDTFLARSEG